jgi:hypothetical protein
LALVAGKGECGKEHQHSKFDAFAAFSMSNGWEILAIGSRAHDCGR